jgi:nicotinate-nucleotide adenylyltransferase
MSFILFGGSFNPPHEGHREIARLALERLGYTRLIVMPAGSPPFKELEADPGPKARLAMCIEAFSDIPGAEVSSLELEREGPSYTIDTLRALAPASGASRRPCLLLGADRAASFGSWKEPEAILALADIAIAGRVGAGLEGGGKKAIRREAFSWPHLDLGNPLHPASSSAVRAALAEGRPVARLVPPGVYRYITENDAYGYLQALIGIVRKRARAALKPERFEHSERVAELAGRLCAREGLARARGVLAGLAHDLCKGMADKELRRLAARDGAPLGGIYERRPSLLHGRAAAVILRDELGVEDGDLLQAVRSHTFGEVGMGPLAAAVYCADKLEDGRSHIGAERRRALLELDLQSMLKGLVADGIGYLRGKGMEVAEESLALAASLGIGATG